MPLGISWTQSLREQRAPKGDQGVEGQGGLWSQAGLAPPPRWVALEEPLNSLICKSRTVRLTFTLRINKMPIRKGPTRLSPSLVRNWLCFPLWPFSGCETAALLTNPPSLLTNPPSWRQRAPPRLFSSMFSLLKCRLCQSLVGNCALAYVMKAVTILMSPKHLFPTREIPLAKRHKG